MNYDFIEKQGLTEKNRYVILAIIKNAMTEYKFFVKSSFRESILGVNAAEDAKNGPS